MHFSYQGKKPTAERVYIFSAESIHSLECIGNIANALTDLSIGQDKVYGNIPQKIFRVDAPAKVEAAEIIAALDKVGIKAEYCNLATTDKPSTSSITRPKIR